MASNLFGNSKCDQVVDLMGNSISTSTSPIVCTEERWDTDREVAAQPDLISQLQDGLRATDWSASASTMGECINDERCMMQASNGDFPKCIGPDRPR